MKFFQRPALTAIESGGGSSIPVPMRRRERSEARTGEPLPDGIFRGPLGLIRQIIEFSRKSPEAVEKAAAHSPRQGTNPAFPADAAKNFPIVIILFLKLLDTPVLTS